MAAELLTFPPHQRHPSLTTSSGRARLDWHAVAITLHRQLRAAIHHNGTVIIDLSPFSIISSDALVPLLAVVRHRALHRPGRTGVRIPGDADALRYLSQLSFLGELSAMGVPVLGVPPEALLALQFAHLAPSSDSRDRAFSRRSQERHRLVQIEPITPESVDLVTSAVYRALEIQLNRHGLRFAAGTEQARYLDGFVALVEEIIKNTRHHAFDSSRQTAGAVIGYACYRPWPTRLHRLRFTCSDLGPGLQTTLTAKAVRVRTDAEAIEEALLYRSTPAPTKVFGLFDALQLLARMTGAIYAMTGSAVSCLNLLTHSRATRWNLAPTRKTLRELLESIHAEPRSSDPVPGVHYCIDINIAKELAQ